MYGAYLMVGQAVTIKVVNLSCDRHRLLHTCTVGSVHIHVSVIMHPLISPLPPLKSKLGYHKSKTSNVIIPPNLDNICKPG